MQKQHNQQSIVRTDFTLKYYQIDDKLQSAALLKIVGSDTKLFVRSWLDYSLVKGDQIVPWLSGDIDVLIKTFNHMFKQSIEGKDALKSFILSNAWHKPLIFAVNAKDVNAGDFKTLLTLLKQQSLSTEVPVNAKQQGIEDESDKIVDKPVTSPAKSQDYLANIVLWLPEDEKCLKNYQELLGLFTATLDIGKTNTIEQSKPYRVTSSSKYIAALGVFFLASVAVFWFVQQGSEPIPNSEKASLPLAQESAPAANQILDEQNKPKLSSPVVQTEVPSGQKKIFENVIQSSQIKSDGDLTESLPPAVNLVHASQDRLVASQNPSSKFKSTKNSQTVVSDISAQNNLEMPENSPKIVVEDTRLMAAKSNVVSKQEPLNTVKVKLEKVTIAATSNAKAINTGSSINTSSAENLNVQNTLINKAEKVFNDKQIAELVDAWIEAWQTKNFTDYSQHYADTFTSNKKMSHDDWLSGRKKRIKRPQWIKLSRSDIKYIPDQDDNIFQITFTLSYSAPNYQDKTLKRMTFKRFAEGYKIITEENLKIIR